MAYANQVAIGPEFFAKAKNDYNDWHWALVREFLQNSGDCGSNDIEVTIKRVPVEERSAPSATGVTRVTVKNNGAPMDREVIVNKLLALGASGKDFAGTVGGFGKAKEILYFCWLNYRIHSGKYLVEGSGAGYNLSETDYIHGTESTIEIGECDCIPKLVEQVKKFAAMWQWRGNLRLTYLEDGWEKTVRLETDLRKGAKRRDLGWAKIYTNKTFPHRLVVRVGGMPMFSRYISLERCVVLEVDRDSGEAFTSNRDDLKADYRRKLEAFVDELTVDKRSALRDVPSTTYHYFEGDKQNVGTVNAAAVQELISAAYATIPQAPSQNIEENTVTLEVDRQTDYDDGPSFIDRATKLRGGQCSYEFVIKNNTGMQVPSHFVPYDFSAYSKKLVSVWIRCMLEIHRMFEHADTFSVGFLLDDEREAEHEKTEQYGRVYYVNPAVVVEQAASKSRSLRKRWKFNNAGYYKLLAVAAHEFVHGLGYSPHDEDYANKLTDTVAIVMAQKKRFHYCFR